MIYSIPVKWSHWGIHEVEANSIEEAMHYVKFMPLPFLDEYIPESFEILKDDIKEIK